MKSLKYKKIKPHLYIKIMLITHEFPLQFYLDGFAEQATSYDYCLIHRYLQDRKYRHYMKNQVKKGRTVYLDNSLYELGKAWDPKEYARIIDKLKPSHYMLPDVFADYKRNIEAQVSFYNNYSSLESKPIAIPHANKLEGEDSLIESINGLRDKIPGCMIALPFGDYSFLNDHVERGYYSYKEGMFYLPWRQALNRRRFLQKHHEELKDVKIHLLGCKSLAEFYPGKYNFHEGDAPSEYIEDNIHYDKSNIVSLDTSHPVAFTLEDPYSRYNNGVLEYESYKGTPLPRYVYKSEYLIDKHFKDKFYSTVYENLPINIKFFQDEVQKWYNVEVWNFKGSD